MTQSTGNGWSTGSSLWCRAAARNRSASTGPAAGGLTDTDFPSVSINSRTSLSELSEVAGQDISLHRWRGNIWVEGFAPREEFTWVGKAVRIGTAELEVVETIQRCEATAADPETGRRNLATLDLLEHNWGHRDFGVYARVTGPGVSRSAIRL